MEVKPKLVVGDARYGTIPNIAGFEERGIKAYLATPDLSQRTKYYPAKLFHYDPENDWYVCPKGKYSHFFLEERQSRCWFINSEPTSAMSVR